MKALNNTLYLYDTTVELVLQGNQYYLDNRPMNTRYFKAHRGVNNVFHFNVTDRDRVGQNMFNRISTAVIVDTVTRTQIFEKQATTGLDVGKISIELTPSDLRDIEPGLYEMFLTTQYEDGVESPLYSTQDNDLTFDLEVTDQGRYDPPPTQETSQMFIGVGNVVVSETLNGNLRRNHNNPQHTMAISTEAYTGNITVQSSQIPGAPSSEADSKDWSDMFTIQANNSSSVHSFTFVKNTNWIRVKHEPADANSFVGVTRIQLRN